jgi:hypothetical protein
MRTPTACCTVALLLAAPVAAQRGVQLTPTVGVYVPTFDLMDESAPGSGQITIGQRAALSVGGRVGIGLSGRATIEGVISYAPSEITVDAPALGYAPQDASITMVGVVLVSQLSPVRSALALHLDAGLAAVFRSGRFWDYFERSLAVYGFTLGGKNDIGVLVGGGLRAHLRGGVTLRADVEAHIHMAGFTMIDRVQKVRPPLDTQSQLQADMRVMGGVTLGGMRR